MAQIFRLDAHDIASRLRRSSEQAHHAYSTDRTLGDKLQLLALQHPATLKVLEELVNDTLRRLNETKELL